MRLETLGLKKRGKISIPTVLYEKLTLADRSVFGKTIAKEGAKSTITRPSYLMHNMQVRYVAISNTLLAFHGSLVAAISQFCCKSALDHTVPG